MRALFLVSLICLAGTTISFNINRDSAHIEQRIPEEFQSRIREKRALTDFGLRTIWNAFGKELLKKATMSVAVNARSLFSTVFTKFFSSSAVKAEEKLVEVASKTEAVIKQVVEEAPLVKGPAQVEKINLLKSPAQELEKIELEGEKVLDEVFEETANIPAPENAPKELPNLTSQNNVEFANELVNNVNFQNEMSNNVEFPNELYNNIEFPNELPNNVEYPINYSNNLKQNLIVGRQNLHKYEYNVYNESPNSDIEMVLLPRHN